LLALKVEVSNELGLDLLAVHKLADLLEKHKDEHLQASHVGHDVEHIGSCPFIIENFGSSIEI